MPGEKNCRLLQLDPTTEQKQKKKKKTKTQKTTGSTDNADKRQSASQAPAPLPPPQGLLPRIKTSGSKKTAERPGKKTSKKSPGLQGRETSREGAEEAQDPESQPCVQARETLRWEGVLQDPQAEARRLEQYRADRRLRYIAHREALLRETQHALRQTLRTELLEKKNLSAGSEPAETEPVLSKSGLK